jgi:TrmH family RNA methyltransferase
VASTDARLESIDTSVMAACAATWLLDAKLFAEISQVETSSGWGLVIPVPAQAQPIARRPNDGHASVQGDVVILDRLQDPGNAGTILRSAAASGISAVWAVTGTVDLWSPKVLRAAMGAHFVVEIVESMSEEAVLLRAHELGVNVLATANSSNAVPLYAPTLNLCDRLAWIFGQEGDGVSNTLLARSQTVVIPQSDQVESLNVAAAASVCLFETLRRKRFA